MFASIKEMNYRIAGKFRGVLIFVIFVVKLVVTKFSTHNATRMCMRTSGKSHYVGVVTSVAGRLAVKLAGQLIAQIIRRVNKMSFITITDQCLMAFSTPRALYRSRFQAPAVLSEVNKTAKLVAARI